MARLLQKWTVVASAGVIVVGLLACKKDEEAPEPVASASAEPAPADTAKEEKDAAPADDKKKVKRYDDETTESGTVRVAVSLLRVYDEASTGGEVLTTLAKGTLVNRKARRGNFMLIEYPSGHKELSPGWVQIKQVSTKVENVDPDDVRNQDAGAAPPETEEKDAGKADEAKDAGTAEETKDAGTAEAKPDAGLIKIKPPKLKLPGRGIPAPPGGRPNPN